VGAPDRAEGDPESDLDQQSSRLRGVRPRLSAVDLCPEKRNNCVDACGASFAALRDAELLKEGGLMQVEVLKSRTPVPVGFRVAFPKPKLTPTPSGFRVEVDGCFAGGSVPGAPALPRRIVRVALPFGHEPVGVEITAVETVVLTDEPVLVAAIGNSVRNWRSRPCVDGPPPPPSVEPTLPDLDLYEQELREPRSVARLLGRSRIGITPVAVIELAPVRYTSDGRLEAVTVMSVSVRSEQAVVAPFTAGVSAIERDADGFRPERFILSPAQATRFYEMAQLFVLNPESVVRTPPDFIGLLFPWEYLVITTASGDGSASDGVTFADVFQRLVDWKWSRGITGRVVTVEEIEAGEHGDFSADSVDRAEIIRKFLQWAVARWGVSWVLIGGSDEIIPARRVAGCSHAEILLRSNDPPQANESFWTGSFLKMNIDESGWEDWSGFPADLVRLDNGLQIPWDSTARSGDPERTAVFGPELGWYFTTDDYTTPSSSSTSYIRVNGLAIAVEADHHFVYDANLLPTDLYYASLYDPLYGLPGRHDWDVLRNGLYGQHSRGVSPAVDLDGVSYHADVSVGRAPAHTVNDARAFVDKVIAYERGRGLDGSWVAAEWHERVVFAAANFWGGRWPAGRTTTPPPQAKQYYNDDGKTVIQFEGTPPSLDWRLISQVSDTDARVLPYDIRAHRGGRGWYWVADDGDETPSIELISFRGLLHQVPIPTPWVVVYGAADELTPQEFVLNQEGLDESATTQERQRMGLPLVMPSLTRVSRLYEDDVDVPPADVPAAPLGHLTENTLKTTMDAGPHIVALSGHGNPGWTCDIFNDTWRSLRNNELFITYASGCQTAKYEGSDVMGQVAVNGEHGAVAYIGNSRDGWLASPTQEIQNTFFDAMKMTDHLGLLHDARLQAVSNDTSHDVRWEVFVQNRVGDPEMRIWNRSPSRLIVKRNHAVSESKLSIHVHKDRVGQIPVAKAMIRIRQGPHKWLAETNDAGEATLEVTPHGIAPLELTVSAPNCAPHVEAFAIAGAGWITGIVVSLDHTSTAASLRAGTTVAVHITDTDENHGKVLHWTIPSDLPDHELIASAAAQALVCCTPASFYVHNRNGESVATGFRLNSPGP
jgi:hypothetical protein